ncbi:MAG: ribosome small subunit-dependent GTPase [Bacteroidota bacterium]|jgi:ribosome biogenesis GTPase
MSQKALIYKSTGSWYSCKTEDGKFWNARTKGKMKIDKEITSTNPIAVGDIVNIEPEDDDTKSAMIVSIEKRKNYLVRTSPHNKRMRHIVASNLDQSLLICTLKDPRTSTGFIDRFLVSCEVYHIPAVLVFNKSDTYDDTDLQEFARLKQMYEAVGYPVYLIAAGKHEGMVDMQSLLQHKVSLLTGHSGVGKSTFINAMLPHKDIKTQEVSDWSGKGMHTTTFAEMHDLPNGGELIDTPGIRELGIIDVRRAELSGYYPDIKKIALQCKYNNCLHFNEPGCAVKEAVQSGVLYEERYINYAKIFESLSDKNW